MTSPFTRILSTPLLIALGVLAVLTIVALLFRLFGRNQKAQNTSGTYEAVSEFLTPAERSFFGVLEQAVASDYRIFAKVRLADIVRPVRNPSRSGWQSAFNRISAKHVDFVLCDSLCLGVMAVIELDDRSHERFERGIRDSLVDSALASARIPILRIPASRSYSPVQIREQVEILLRSGGNTPNNVA